jgi:hypothetical protein
VKDILNCNNVMKLVRTTSNRTRGRQSVCIRSKGFMIIVRARILHIGTAAQ